MRTVYVRKIFFGKYMVNAVPMGVVNMRNYTQETSSHKLFAIKVKTVFPLINHLLLFVLCITGIQIYFYSFHIWCVQ